MRIAAMPVLLALTLPGVALASAEGDKILADMDAAMNRAQDLTITWKVINMEPGKTTPREMRFEVYVKGLKQLTEFEQPADLKGTRVLVLSRSQMYIWLPSFGKVRRIASHVTQQGFMGTAFAHHDMSSGAFGDVYEASVLSSDGESWKLALTPRPDAEAPYARAEVTVTKSNNLPVELDYFDAKGSHVKTETRSGYECRDAVCLPGVIRMEDHARNGAWTELRREEWELNSGISDSIFSVRTLQTGL